jgi:putative transposase
MVWYEKSLTLNHLHGYLNDAPPAEFEATFCTTKRNDQPLVEIE